MKMMLYILVLCGVIVIPIRGTDVGKLIPVEVIAISESGGTVSVNTDTGDAGKGTTLQGAFADMKDKAAGIIYLDTAEYLLLEPGLEIAEALSATLKGNIKVYHAPADMPMDGLANYLSVHKSKVRLEDISEYSGIPEITVENGRYLMNEK